MVYSIRSEPVLIFSLSNEVFNLIIANSPKYKQWYTLYLRNLQFYIQFSPNMQKRGYHEQFTLIPSSSPPSSGLFFTSLQIFSISSFGRTYFPDGTQFLFHGRIDFKIRKHDILGCVFLITKPNYSPQYSSDSSERILIPNRTYKKSRFSFSTLIILTISPSRR